MITIQAEVSGGADIIESAKECCQLAARISVGAVAFIGSGLSAIDATYTCHASGQIVRFFVKADHLMIETFNPTTGVFERDTFKVVMSGYGKSARKKKRK